MMQDRFLHVEESYNMEAGLLCSRLTLRVTILSAVAICLASRATALAKKDTQTRTKGGRLLMSVDWVFRKPTPTECEQHISC